ncbi:MAG: cysteine desulfurase NifS [bacterium]
MRIVYLDNNATTRVAPEAVEAMLPFLKEQYGNPSSMHTFGGEVGAPVEHARAAVAKLVGAERASEIVFTSCGTEADSTAILSALNTQPDKNHIITTRVEHPAVRSLAFHLRRKGVQVTEIPVDSSGLIDPRDVERAITKNTAIVSIMAANNETGVRFPIAEIGRTARAHGVLFHTDAVQLVGKDVIDVEAMAVDFLALSGHKIHAPKGIGALYVRRGTRFRPFLIGGHQERGRRGGTEAVPNVVALGRAAELALEHLEGEQTRVRALRDRLERGLLDAIPSSRVNGDLVQRLPNTTNVSFEHVEGEAILLMMSDLGMAASSGSACTSGSLEPSHVLRAMGIPYTFAHGSIRYSLSRYSTDEDVDYVLEHMPPIIARLREISPFWKSN